MVVEKAGRISSWNWEQEKAFENALAIHPEGYIDLWEKIKLAVPGKTVEEIKQHYALLIEDINRIESGQVPLPNYVGAFYGSYDDGATAGKDERNCEFNQEVKSKRREQKPRKGRPWTEEEHRNFLRGIQVFGKGDWRSISRMFVKSRSPTQVASHAQKFYNRKKSSSKDRKRSSIHDITDVSSGDTSAPQVPISGQADCPIAQPAEPLISADGTPNNLRIPAASQMPSNAIQNQVSIATMKHQMLQRHLH